MGVIHQWVLDMRTRERLEETVEAMWIVISQSLAVKECDMVSPSAGIVDVAAATAYARGKSFETRFSFRVYEPIAVTLTSTTTHPWCLPPFFREPVTASRQNVSEQQAQRSVAHTPNDEFMFERSLGPDTVEPTLVFRGSTLSPEDFPLKTGQFLSTLPLLSSINLEINEIGDVLLRRGDLPAYPNPAYSDPGEVLLAHRTTGSIGGEANGGLGCTVESWWLRNVRGAEDVPVNLSVKNGRWRVGRGRLCTMGRSPRPAGSWRAFLPRFIPGNARGKALRAASLQLLPSGNVVVASGDEVFWDSYRP